MSQPCTPAASLHPAARSCLVRSLMDSSFVRPACCPAGFFHSYLILEQFAKVSPRAAAVFRYVAAVWTVVFVIVRR